MAQLPISGVSDERFMRIALYLARRMQGATAPNPAVGAVIVDEATGEVIARGWTQLGGRPHAETHVIGRAGARARGKTMYVTLEPCSHHGQTPPCVDAIKAAGLARVVCAIEDPDPRVSGRGIAELRAAGVRVDSGSCAEEARWVAGGHIMRMQQGRPLVVLKLAVSADGRIARGHGRPTWVTGETARALGHLLRARVDAILVGRQTVVDDNPLLTCRLPGLMARSPRRYVLDSSFRTPPTSRILTEAGDVPATLVGARDAPEPAFPALVQTRRVGLAQGGRLALDEVLRLLSEDGVTRLLVEGGPILASAFLVAGLVDEAVIFCSGKSLGAAGVPALVDRGLEEFEDARRWHIADARAVGEDRVTTYRARERDHS